jgi:cytochrome c-type biogenesis protein CcmE
VKPQSRRLLVLVGALGVATTGLFAVAFSGIGENLVYYWSPDELLDKSEQAYGPTIRLGGVVRPGSIAWDAERTHLAFAVAQDHTLESRYVNVQSNSVPPQMFRDGIGIVVEGTFDRAQVFTASRVMVNHSNEYRAPEDELHDDVRAELETTGAAQ